MSERLPKPNNLDDAALLLAQPQQLELFLRANLVMIAAGGGAAGVRAIELLHELPAMTFSDELDDVPMAVLIEAEKRADAFIRRLAEDGGESEG